MKTVKFITCLSALILFQVFSPTPVLAKNEVAVKTVGETPQQRIERIGATLVRFNTATHAIEYVFTLDDDSEEINAWADVDGEIEMTIGFYNMFKHSDEELAFFLAHEMAHINLDHHEGKENLADALEALSGNSDEKKQELELAFERKQEASADKYGILYLVRSGYSSMAAVRGFLTLKKYGYDFTPHKEQRTRHPTTSNRIEDALKMVLEISQSTSQYEYGLMYLAQGKYEEAEECFLEFLEMFPLSKEANTNLGICYSHLATADMTPPEYLYKFSVAKLDTGHFIKSLGFMALNPNYAEAQKAYNKALEVDAEYGEALNNLGLLLALAGETDKGISYLKKAMEVDGKNALYANNFGVAATIAGDMATAEQTFFQASMEKDLAVAQYNSGRILWDQGKQEKAVQYLNRYLAIVPTGDLSEKIGQMLAAIDNQNDAQPTNQLQDDERLIETSLAGIDIGMDSSRLMAIHGKSEKIVPLVHEKWNEEAWQYFDNRLSFVLVQDADGQMHVTQIVGSGDPEIVLKTQKGILINDPQERVLKKYGQPEMKVKEGPYEIWSYSSQGLGFFMDNNVVDKIYVGSK